MAELRNPALVECAVKARDTRITRSQSIVDALRNHIVERSRGVIHLELPARNCVEQFRKPCLVQLAFQLTQARQAVEPGLICNKLMRPGLKICIRDLPRITYGHICAKRCDLPLEGRKGLSGSAGDLGSSRLPTVDRQEGPFALLIRGSVDQRVESRRPSLFPVLELSARHLLCSTIVPIRYMRPHAVDDVPACWFKSQAQLFGGHGRRVIPRIRRASLTHSKRAWFAHPTRRSSAVYSSRFQTTAVLSCVGPRATTVARRQWPRHMRPVHPRA